MNIQTTHCPGRGHGVRMLWHDVPPHARDASRPGSMELICLDADGSCADPVCHLLGVATCRMEDRLRRYLDPRPWDDGG